MRTEKVWKIEYVACDGTRFNNGNDCVEYENARIKYENACIEYEKSLMKKSHIQDGRNYDV